MQKGPAKIPHIHLAPEQLEELERLSALGYSTEDMAMYFSIQKELFIRAANDPDSTINYHIHRGKMVSIAREQLAILTSAESGNITASQQLEKIRRNKGFEISKLDIFGGFDTAESYQKLEDYILTGGSKDLSKEETIYLEALTLMNSMDRKYGRRRTVEFFTKPPFNLKYSRASEMYDEALALFYTDRNVEKKALRHKLAEQIAEAALLVKTMANCAKDMEIYGTLKMQESNLRELHKADPVPLSKELYIRPVRLFSLDPEMVGITGINRQEIASQIDELEIPERDKLRLRQDAMIDAIKLEDTLDELEEESKSR